MNLYPAFPSFRGGPSELMSYCGASQSSLPPRPWEFFSCQPVSCVRYLHEFLKVKRLTQGHSTSSWSKDFNLHSLIACPSLSHQDLPPDKHPVVWQHPGLPGRSPLPSDLHAIRLPCDSHQTPFGNHVTQIETWTYGLLTEITHLVQGLMKLGFLMSYHRKNSVRDKVIGKKWIYLERCTLHRVWAISEHESGPRVQGCQLLLLFNC